MGGQLQQVPEPAREIESATADGEAAWVHAAEAGARRYLRVLGCPDSLADDLLQEALLAALHKRAHLLPGPVARSWLRSALRNLWRHHARAHSRRPPTVGLDEVELAWGQFARDDDGAGYLSALRLCLAGLDERERTAIQLRHGEGLSTEAIAARLDLRPEGAKTVLRRARERLRTCILRRTERRTP